MHEKELRIALVCFGGVSLAVYMHGIIKELLKLTRASRALHAIENRAARRTAGFFDEQTADDAEYDSEAVYFELLRDLGPDLELRVIIDIIAGSSAGGINSTMLARALSHDLRIGRLRDLWLDNADVTELLASEARARRWSKWFLRPLFWVAGAGEFEPVRDAEIRSKLSLFMRSRWFKPPFDGMKMAALMYDAVQAMQPRKSGSSLLPSGQGLDLFVTVTDFYGRQQLIQIHDPPLVHEREHRHVLHYRYRRRASGTVDSDFELDNAPALAFAARATSSIPGIFPPAQILEVDRLVRMRGGGWPRRDAFISRNFEHYRKINIDVASIPFIDGGVLNSRPFRVAIAAIRGRPAYREVDRRVIYIDPNPTPAGFLARHGVPGFFSTLKGALSDIPLAEPITDELDWIARINERARRLRAIIESARPHISGQVADVLDHNDFGSNRSKIINVIDSNSLEHDVVRKPLRTFRHHALGDASVKIDVEQMQHWRKQANIKSARDAGFAYETYVRLKLASAHDFVARLVMEIRGQNPNSPFGRAIAEIIDVWATRAGVTYEPTDTHALQAETATPGSPDARWVAFLLSFDVDYRKRRLHFLIEGQNRLYQMLGEPALEGLDNAMVDRLKRLFYEQMEVLDRRIAAAVADTASRDLVEDLFRAAPSPAEMRGLRNYAESFVARHRTQLDRLIGQLAAAVDLDATTRNIDHLLTQLQDWPAPALHEVLINYLGFSFWDVLTFPILPWREAGEFNEIKVDRISAQDAREVERLGTFPLKGTAFNQFAAFFSRSYRENDYLLGRLHAFDRLIDIVCDAAGPGVVGPALAARFKKRGFLRILDNEEAHLPTCAAMIAQLRTTLAAEHLG